MRFRNGMTSVVGTALAVVAAGSLVLFSVLLQRSAFDDTTWRPLDTKTPGSNATTAVQVPGFDGSTKGGGTVADLGNDGGDAPLPPNTDQLSPFPSDDLAAGEGPLVAAVDEPPARDGDNPTFDGGTGVGPGIIGGPGPSFSNSGPEATINNDQNAAGKPGHEPLPDNDGPKDVNPPHGPNGPRDPRTDDRGSSPDSPRDIDDHAKPGKAPKVRDKIPVNKPGKALKDKPGKRADSNKGRDSRGHDARDRNDRDHDSRDHDSRDHDSRDHDSRDHDSRDHDSRDHDSRDHDKGGRHDGDKPDKPSKPEKDSKPPKVHQPKPPEPKGNDDDDDDDDDSHDRDRDDSNDSGSNDSGSNDSDSGSDG